jgi:hypothetical protein
MMGMGMKEGEELCYDYGMRTGGWMRRGPLVEGRVCTRVKDGGEASAVKEEPVEVER